MYKQVETDEVFTLNNGAEVQSHATLADEYGGRAQIATDDHCYVLYLNTGDGYKMTKWIFKEAFEVLKQLPSPE